MVHFAVFSSGFPGFSPPSEVRLPCPATRLPTPTRPPETPKTAFADYFPPPASVKLALSPTNAGGKMKFSTAGMELLKRSEGFRNRVYLDVAGFPTIGYGHRLLHPESFPNGITEAQATN